MNNRKGEYLIGDKRYYTNGINYFRIRAALGFVELLIKRKDECQDKKKKRKILQKSFFFYRQESGSSIVWNVINSPYVVIEDPAG